MTKRSKIEIMKDILEIINRNPKIRITPLLRKSNLSSERFKEYFLDLQEKGFVNILSNNNIKTVSITEKGIKFLDKYKTILSFIEEFEL